jgi:hypothetical protein
MHGNSLTLTSKTSFKNRIKLNKITLFYHLRLKSASDWPFLSGINKKLECTIEELDGSIKPTVIENFDEKDLVKMFKDRLKTKIINKKAAFSSTPVYQLKVNSEDDIMNEIIENGPVQAVFRFYNDLFLYKSGIYSVHPGATSSGKEDEKYHSVVVVGWGEDDGIKYWVKFIFLKMFIIEDTL